MVDRRDVALAGRSAIITGAGWGIGHACSTLFAREGASLTLLDMNQESLQSTSEVCRNLGAEVAEVVGDVSEIAVIDAAMSAAAEGYGRIDILVNSAVYRVKRPFPDVTPEEFVRSLMVNVAGYYLMAQRIVPDRKSVV